MVRTQYDHGDDERILREVVQRIVEVARPERRPERILLFGSAARGTPSGPYRDLDLLVGAPQKARPGYYPNLAGVGRAVDVVVVTPEDIERYGKSPALVIEPALREGRLVYDASSFSQASYFGRPNGVGGAGGGW